ncbi:Uncharacterised protein [Mycobacteroides abscessus subsp. abscessus]|nr:Uncharacterised protein [Mycobacteroides abscessus subsp. abscessus]
MFTECLWFLWPILAKCSAVVPYFCMCSRPAAPNIQGAGGKAKSNSPASASMCRCIGCSRSVKVAPNEPGCIFSKPSARVTSGAVDPVEQLLLTLVTGIPVMPSSYTARWPEVDSPAQYPT